MGRRMGGEGSSSGTILSVCADTAVREYRTCLTRVALRRPWVISDGGTN